MRIGYVGVSTPIGYDYGHNASKAKSDLSDSPNPILESPFGLMLLYDEIWFLCKSLCPENMRSLPYVKFMDEKRALPKLNDIKFGDIPDLVKQNTALNMSYPQYENKLPSFGETLKNAGVCWASPIDNHTHGLKIGDFCTYGNSRNISNVFFDMEVVRRTGNKNVELVTNSYSQGWLNNNNPLMQAKLTELLIIDGIPNYQTPSGPYFSCVEQVRDDSFLKDFREWVATKSLSADERELLEMKRGVEATIKQSEEDIFLKELGKERCCHSLAKTVVGEVVSSLVPGGSMINGLIDLAKEFNDFCDFKQRRWQGFVVSARRKIK